LLKKFRLELLGQFDPIENLGGNKYLVKVGSANFNDSPIEAVLISLADIKAKQS
jgi:hypothetical protein